MLQIKQFTKIQIEKLYKEHLISDFVPEEQKPLELMMELMDSGNYFGFGYYEENELVAYTLFACISGLPYCLIDYFAVCKGFRSRGYGTFVLQHLNEVIQAYDGIIFEVESGKSAKNAQEAMNCERRLKFYRTNGLTDTILKVNMFGIDMNVLFYSFQEEVNQKMIYHSLDEIYQLMFGKNIYGKKLKLFIDN